MGFRDWWSNFLGGSDSIDCTNLELKVEFHVKKLAIETCIDIIANAITKCEFQTFYKGEEIRKNNYYLFNVQPNVNQNATEFKHKLVHTLLYENDCLVIMVDDQYLVADDYTMEEFALKENVYKNVVVGDMTFNKPFFEKEVIHLKYNNANIRKVIDELYDSYGKLLSSAIDIYKRSNAKRYILKGEFIKNHDKEIQAEVDKLFNESFKGWLKADSAGSFIHIGKNLELLDMSGSGKIGTSNFSSRDIRNIADDVIDFTAMAFHIPRGLIKGDVADVEKQVDTFLMFGVEPIVKLIQAEFNRKIYEKEEYLERTFLKIDTSMIKIIDIVQLATAADKFFATGIHSANMNKKMVGQEPINEPWANEHYVTKNYQKIEQVNTDASKGGEGG